MAREPIDWYSVTIVLAQQRWTGHQRPDVVRIKVGAIRLPDGDSRIAMQVDDRPPVLVPPASAARIIGALARALRDGR